MIAGIPVSTHALCTQYTGSGMTLDPAFTAFGAGKVLRVFPNRVSYSMISIGRNNVNTFLNFLRSKCKKQTAAAPYRKGFLTAV